MPFCVSRKVQILQQLLEMGFSEGASARALLATRGDSAVESAVAWLELHAADEGLDLPLTEQEAEALRESAESRPSLSEEEAQRKAYELQRKVRMVSLSALPRVALRLPPLGFASEKKRPLKTLPESSSAGRRGSRERRKRRWRESVVASSKPKSCFSRKRSSKKSRGSERLNKLHVKERFVCIRKALQTPSD